MARLGTRKNPVCRLETSPCEPTHGDVLNLHTGKREGEGSLLSLVPSLFLSSFFFLSSVVLFFRSLFLSLLFLSSLVSQ